MRLRSGNVIGELDGKENECCVCYNEKHIPIFLQPCEHSFCSTCVKSLIWNGQFRIEVIEGNNQTPNQMARIFFGKCPLCRSYIAKADCKQELEPTLRQNYPMDFIRWKNAREQMNDVLNFLESLQYPLQYFQSLASLPSSNIWRLADN